MILSKSNQVEVLNVDDDKDEQPKELVWARFEKLSLTRLQRDKIEVGHRLNNYHINFAQIINIPLKDYRVPCFKRPTKLQTTNYKIVHSRGNLWIVAYALFSAVGSVDVYGSLYDILDDESIVVIRYLFQNPNIKINMINTKIKRGMMTVDYSQ